jgi:hypothetical protein
VTLTVTAPNRRSSTGGGMAASYACPGLVPCMYTYNQHHRDSASACRLLRGSDAKGPLHSSDRRGTRHTKRCEATQAVSAGLRRGDPSLRRRTRREAAGQLQSPHPQSVSSSRPAGMSAHDDHPPGDSDHDHHDHEHDPAAAWSDDNHIIDDNDHRARNVTLRTVRRGNSHTVFTFQDPIIDPEIGTASIGECRLPDYVTCETTWTGTWVRRP